MATVTTGGKDGTGILISFEGIDGAGKSTHIEALAQALRSQGRTLTLTREPGGTPLAEKLRLLLLQDPMDAMTEALLVFAARRDHLQSCIEPALARGEVVLCDRFTDATFAYQGGRRCFDQAMLSFLEQQVQARQGLQANLIRQPDLTVWFDLAPEVAAVRLADARLPDRFEAQPLEFFRRVAAGYGRRQQADPGRFARIDASQPRESVWLAVQRAVQSRGWLP
jgi:dTMP kinase